MTTDFFLVSLYFAVLGRACEVFVGKDDMVPLFFGEMDYCSPFTGEKTR